MDMRRSTLGRALQTFAVGKATGERALIVAIIGYAARDALDGDVGAAAWLLSDGYRWYLELLGLPAEWLPEDLDRAQLAGMVERAAAGAGQLRASTRRTRSAPSAASTGTHAERRPRSSTRGAGRAGHILSQIITG